MCDLDMIDNNRNNQHSAPARTDNRQSGSRFFFSLFSFETRRLRGDGSFRPEPLRIPPLEDIEFLDDIQIKIQNMRFKSITNDQTVPRYSYFNFYKPHKVDGKGFSSQMPTLKTARSDQKSNRRT